MTTRAFIAGCSGPVVKPEEAAFFRAAEPWGFILFRRNVETPEQVRALTAALRETVGRADAPVLIDQEGGRVQRLGPPHWPAYPPGRAYGRLYAADPSRGREIARLGARLIAHDLNAVGIDVDCLPVLDVPVAGAHDVIGDRAYAHDPETVAVLGRAAAEGLIAGGVLPVIKHIPGHGRAGADSHHDLPVVHASREELERQDFVPFRHLADMPLAMTAHVVYTALDPDNPATTSPVVMAEVIRGHMGYDGLVMSDDLSMNALAGALAERARAAFKAGCDVALHCNGRLDEMEAVASETPELAGDAARRAAAALGRIRRHAPEPLNVVDARARFAAALAAAA
jgi:beta-N-acetylhexosaminidase